MSSAKVTAEKVGGQFVKAYYQAVQNVEKKRLISFYNVVRSVPLFRLRSSPPPPHPSGPYSYLPIHAVVFLILLSRA